MTKSESIKEIAIALAKFNGEVSTIAKDAKNPQFRSEYVTLDALIQATRPVLQSNGLSIMQFPLTKETGEIGVQTVLLHESGEFIESEPLYMTPVRMVKGGEFEVAKDPQAAGSVISYLRRYSYQAILNLNTGEDDDGNQASPEASKPVKKGLTSSQIKRLYTKAYEAGIKQEHADRQILNYYGCSVSELTKEQYDAACAGFDALVQSKSQKA